VKLTVWASQPQPPVPTSAMHWKAFLTFSI
jgi:hypothetical protein